MDLHNLSTPHIGDLLIEVKAESGIAKLIDHGTNCQGSFNSGFAGQLRRIYPEAREEYLRAYDNNLIKLGGITSVGNDYLRIINANTQEFYGRVENTQYVSYQAVKRCFSEVNDVAVSMLETIVVDDYGVDDEIKTGQVHIPHIGCGLAGGDWDIILKIILEEIDLRVQVHTWKLPKNAVNKLNPDYFSFPG